MSQDPPGLHPLDALSALVDGELSAGERAQVDAHLSACSGCRDLLQDLRRLDAALGVEVAPPVPDGLARRIRARIDATPSAPARARGGRPAWLSPWPLAAAAGLVLAAALWLVAPFRRPAPVDEDRRLAKVEMDKVEMDQGAAQRVPPPPAPSPTEPPASPPAAAEPTRRESPREEPRSRAPKKKSGTAPRSDEVSQSETVMAYTTGNRPETGADGGRSGGAVTKGVAGGVVGGVLGAGKPDWPVWIEAPPYHVELTARDTMIVSVGNWVCPVTIDAEDGNRLAQMARSEVTLVTSGGPAAAPSSAPAAAAAPAASASGATQAPGAAPKPATDAEPASPQAPAESGAERSAAQRAAAATVAAQRAIALVPSSEAALRMIRERYRAQIEQRCGPPPR